MAKTMTFPENPYEVYALDLTDSGELLDNLWEQYFSTKDKNKRKQISKQYQLTVNHHNKLAGFKRYSLSIK